MSAEGIAFYLDSDATKTFQNTMIRDERCHPEILQSEEAGWTFFFPSFDPLADKLQVLREQVDAFCLGFLDAETMTVTGASPLATCEALIYEEFCELKRRRVSVELDNTANGKLASLAPSLEFLRYGDD